MFMLPQRIYVGATCLVLLTLLSSGACAWELSLSGKFSWEFYQFSQLGSRGFFGPYD